MRPLFSIDAISEVRIEPPAAPAIELQLDAERWLLVEPVHARADRATVSALLEVLRSAVGRPFGSADDDELARYGLHRDAGLRVTVSDGAGREEQLLLGNVVPLDVGYVYALEPRSGAVYRVYREIRTLLEQHPDALRDRSLVDFDPQRAERLSIVRTGKDAPDQSVEAVAEGAAEPIELVRSGQWWELLSPVEAPADAAVIHGLLEAIASLRIATFYDTPASGRSLEDQTDVSARTTVRITMDDGAAHQLELGPVLEDGRHRVVRSGDTESWFGVSAQLTRGWPLTREQLINRAPLRFRVDEIVRVSVTRAEGSFELTRTDDQWLITERTATAEARPAVSAAVRHALSRIMALRVDDLTSGVVPLAAQTWTPGVDPAVESYVAVELEESDGTLHQLELVGESDTELFLGRSSFRAMPFIIEPQALSGLPLSSAALADRRLLPFDANRVAAVEIQTADTTVRLERRDGQWQIESPRRARADQPKAWGVVFALESAQYRQRVSASGGIEELRRDGFGAVTVTLRDSGRGILGTVVLAEGDASIVDDRDEYILAATSARPGIVTADAELLRRIPTRIEDLEFSR